MNNLFIVGAQRSGTSYLQQILNEHNEVEMTRMSSSEPKFFLNKNIKIKDKIYYENKYFDHPKKKTKYLGEKSTSYFENEYALKNIKKLYPEGRILLILRNPVMRAYSNYLFTLKNNLEELSFSDSLAIENERIKNKYFTTSVNPYAYRSRGVYIIFIKKLFNIFNPKQIKILIFEEFINNALAIKKLYNWLEIDETFTPLSINQKINESLNINNKDSNALNELYIHYRESINDLEEFLNFKIDSWHEDKF
tara:strand:+ start:1350 stop:2102 length:753 start_codon:yes stop_codon:yes gene_type:complete